jgi:hypothetical protein
MDEDRLAGNDTGNMSTSVQIHKQTRQLALCTNRNPPVHRRASFERTHGDYAKALRPDVPYLPHCSCEPADSRFPDTCSLTVSLEVVRELTVDDPER